jgi:hypothetical protein
MGGMAGTPLRELMSHARFARLATNEERGLRRALIGLHFRRFATFPQRRTRHPARSSQNFKPPCEAPFSLEASKQPHEAPASLEASMQQKSPLGFEASGSRGVSRGAWPPSSRMSRSGGNAIRLLRGEAALLIHPKREALGVSIRLEGGQAPPITTEVHGIDHLRRGDVPSLR